MPRCSASAIIRAITAGVSAPEYSPESTRRPAPAAASVNCVRGRRVAVRADDDADGQRVLARELEVALVVRGHGHDGAGAVLGEHEVGDPDRHLLAGERVQRRAAGVEAFFLDGAGAAGLPVERAELRDLLAKRRRVGALGGEAVDQRVLGRQQHEGGAEDGVDAGREDLDAEIGYPTRGT